MLKLTFSMSEIPSMKVLFSLGFCVLAGGLLAQVQVSPATPSVSSPQAAPPAPTATISPDTIVAEVDGKKYSAGEVEKVMALFPAQMQPAARKDPQRALGFILMMRHLADEGEKANLDKQSPLKETLEYGRMTALSQAEINQVRNTDVKVEMEDEQKFYKEHPERFQEAKVRVIYIAFSAVPGAKPDAGKKTLTEAEAKAKIEELRKKIEGGADFGKLAKENSDDKESAIKDGDFGIIKRASRYPEPIKAAIFALKTGQVSEPVRQPNGYYLFRSDSVTTAAYNDVRTQIFDELKQKGFDEWMKSMQKRYEVKVENPAYFAPKSPGPLPPSPR